MYRSHCRNRVTHLSLEHLEPRQLLSTGPLITELMAANTDTLRDADRDSSDWVELHNPTADPITLDGWYLTDRVDDLTRWRVPAVTIQPSAYLVLFASGKDRADPPSELHVNFKLSKNGEFLALVQPDGTTIAQQYAPQFPPQTSDISYGLGDDLSTPMFFETPTPGEANVDGALGIVASPMVSVERGFYDTPFDVEVVSATPDSELRYTVDGSRPTSTAGIVYDGPIHVDSTTTLRVGAFKFGFLASDVQTHTYLFLEDVIEQSPNPEGYPTQWVQSDGEVRPGVYGIVPQAVNTHRDTIIDDLQAVPTLSLVMNVDDMFSQGCDSPRTDRPCGAYNSGGSNIDSPTSVELIDPEGREGFQIDAGVRLQGGSSRLPGVGKRNMRLRFSAEFGPTKLEFPLFENSPVDTFDTIIMRANVQDGWHRRAAGQRQLIKDEFARRSQLAMGQPSAHGTWMHLYINGQYWGLYNVVERPNAPFAAEHLGGAKDDWDTLNGGRLREGNLNAWNEMIALTPRGGPDVRRITDDIARQRYEAIQEYLDIEAFIDYVLVGIYMGTEDWLPNNYYAARRSRDGDMPVDPEDPASKFRFFHWDQEKALLGVDQFKNLPSFASPVGRIFQLLRLSDEFVEIQAQRLYKHFFNGGALSPDSAATRYQGLVDEVKDAIKGEAIRWGEAPSNVPGWESEADFLINTLLPSRREGILNQYRQFRLYPQTDAPVFSQQGGVTSPADTLSISATEGAIYYTLDGSDPRLADGTISPSATEYSQPIVLQENTLVRARALANNEWSVYNQAQFFVGAPPPAGAVAITELNYNPTAPTAEEVAIDSSWDSTDFEFIEIYNTTAQAIDLTGAKFTDGVEFEFAAFDHDGQPMRLAAGEYAVITRNLAAFTARYGSDGSRAIGQYTGQLNNQGERIRLEGPLGTTWLDFDYDGARHWPQRADGIGATLQLRDSDNTDPMHYDYSQSWQGSRAFGGSPGRADIESTGIVINELISRPEGTATDSIELYNGSDSAVDIGGWFLSDSADNLFKFQIPAGTVVDPDGYVVFNEGQFNPNPAVPGANKFALSGTGGDDVWLVTSTGTGVASFVDDVHFGAARIGESFGRSPNAVGRLAPMTNQTLGGTNGIPRVGPVIISEVNYNPPNPSPAALAIDPTSVAEDLEFVEIHNPTAAEISLSGWRIRGGVDFDFSVNTQLPAGQSLVLISFDPTDPDNEMRAAALRAHFSLDSTIPLVGGYQGQLRNGGELIQLLRADASPADRPTVVPYVLEDEVLYDDQLPWPTEADGAGATLARAAADAWGNAASSWTSMPPSPGQSGFSVQLLGDTNMDGRFDEQDVAQVLASGKYITGQPANFAEGDWTGDGIFDQLDIVAALQAGLYQGGSFLAVGDIAKRGEHLTDHSRLEQITVDQAFAQLIAV